MSNETIKFKIWNYVRNGKRANIHQIATGLNLTEKDVIVVVEDLQNDKYIKVVPVPLDESGDCSCYYSATEKKLID